MVGKESHHSLHRILEEFAKVKVDSRGRISLPSRFMGTLGITAGDDLYIKITSSRLEIYTSKTLDYAAD